MSDQPGFVPTYESWSWAEFEKATAEPHRYLSTSCHHGLHDYCAAPVRDDGAAKVPASCKFCSSPCVCPCHRDAA